MFPVDKSSFPLDKSYEQTALRLIGKIKSTEEEEVLQPLVKNDIIQNLFGGNYFAVKSIYFDKPESSNWFVAYHQDLTISVDQKMELNGFGPWTVKQNQF